MKRILVTGASRGLGLAISRAMLNKGCAVIGCARSASSEVEALRGQYRENFTFLSADLASREGVLSLCRQARVMEGIDVLVANAAEGDESLLTLMDPASIERAVYLNLTGPILLAREAIKGMLANEPGLCLFISSAAARTGLSGLSVYSAAKAGLLGFSRSIAREYGRKGIRSNCILPGYFESSMTDGLDDEKLERIRRRTALKRLARAEDVVNCVSYLASEEAACVTGAEFVVDGGFSV